MSMTPSDWRALLDNIVAEVERNAISEARIDEAVLRVLRFKKRLGLIDKDYEVGRGLSPDVVGNIEHRALRAVLSERSLVLLKNNGASLPINPTRNIVLVGPAADSIPIRPEAGR